MIVNEKTKKKNSQSLIKTLKKAKSFINKSSDIFKKRTKSSNLLPQTEEQKSIPSKKIEKKMKVKFIFLIENRYVNKTKNTNLSDQI